MGILLAGWTSLPLSAWCAASLLAGGTAVLARRRTVSEAAVLLSLVFAAAFWSESHLDALLSDPVYLAAERGEQVWCCGDVVEEPRLRDDGRRDFVLRVRGFVGAGGRLVPSEARVLVRLPRWVREPLHCGDRVLACGRLRSPNGPRNPGDFDYRAYLLSRDVVATAYVSREEHLRRVRSERNRSLESALVAPAQRFVLRTIYAYLPAREAGLLQGLLLGRKELLDPEIRRAFAELGVVHVLAVSGLHVGYILLILSGLLSLLRVHWRWRWPLVLVGLGFYVLLTGSKPPVVRASVMAAVFLLAECFQRRYDLFNGLGLAALLVLLWQPQQIGQVGFILSFAAVASIALFYPRFRELLGRGLPGVGLWRWVRDLAAVSLAATFGTLPLTLVIFQRLPVFSLPANLVVIPLVGAAVALGIAFVLAAGIFPFLAAPFASACWAALWLVEHLATGAQVLGL
ncbi:MAG: ComEC family competence protein, partial [Calditrichaeota bacterium]|nr:ComEC family competence protein [Calditrichota bacterium]